MKRFFRWLFGPSPAEVRLAFACHEAMNKKPLEYYLANALMAQGLTDRDWTEEMAARVRRVYKLPDDWQPDWSKARGNSAE